MSHTGQMIHQLRMEHKLTQAELAAKLGLTPKMISFYERDERTPSRDILVLLSTIFGISIDYLLCETGDPQTPSGKIIEKFGFFHPYAERAKLKEGFHKFFEAAHTTQEKVAICETDMKQFFSRSIEGLRFDMNHVYFQEYAAMLLNQKHFKEKYAPVYGVLAAKYPPMPGMDEGSTYYEISRKHSAHQQDIQAASRLLGELEPADFAQIMGLVSTLINHGKER